MRFTSSNEDAADENNILNYCFSLYEGGETYFFDSELL